MQTETNIQLNVSELSIILSALQSIELRDEIQINKESGSVSTLYDRLYDHYQGLDSSDINLSYESFIEPSF